MQSSLNHQNILDAFAFLARWCCLKRVHVHAVVGGSCSMILQTQAVRAVADDIDLSFRAARQEGALLKRYQNNELLHDFIDVARSSASFRVDDFFWRLDKPKAFGVEPLEIIRYAAYRNAAGHGATISLTTLDQIFDDKVAAADIGYYACSLNQPRLASKEVEKLRPNLTDALALGALLRRDIFSVKGTRNAFLPRKALNELSPEAIADAKERGCMGRRDFSYQRINL